MSANRDVLRKLAEALLHWDGELRSEIGMYQGEPMKDRCAQPEVRETIELLGYDLLHETMTLDDETFSAVYQTESLSGAMRRELKEMIVRHVQTCQQCQWIAQRGRWLDEKTEHFLTQEKETLRELLVGGNESFTRERRYEAASSRNFSAALATLSLWKIPKVEAFRRRVAFAAMVILAVSFLGVYQWQDSRKAPAPMLVENNPGASAAPSEVPDTNSQAPEVSQGSASGALEEKKPQAWRSRASQQRPRELVAQAQQIDLNRSTFRHGEGKGGEEKPIKISASGAHPTWLSLRLPAGSQKGWYKVSILEASEVKPLVIGRARSRDGKNLALELDLRTLPDDEYELRVSHEVDGLRSCLITISSKEFSGAQNHTPKSSSQPNRRATTP